MSSKLRYLLGAAACCSLLASCGGSNNDTPTPTPTETPTPTPTTTGDPTVAKFDFSEDFALTSLRMYIFAYFTATGSTDEVFSDGRIITDLSGLGFVLDPETVSYRFISAENPVNFEADDRVSATPTLRIYENDNGRLILETPFEFALRAQLELKAPYIRETVPGELRSRRVSLFFNTVTTDQDITDTLTYTGNTQVVGGTSGTTPSDAVDEPELTITVAPGTDGPELTGTLPIVVNINGTDTQLANVTLTATVASTSAFGGNIEDAAAGFSGQFAGSLAGPNREEIVFLFRLAHDDGRKFIGSFIGKLDTSASP